MKKNWKYSLLLIATVFALAMGVFFLFYCFDNKANQIVVGADIEGSFEIKKDSNTTIDLGGYTVTSNGHAFIVESGAKVSINNGKIVAQNKDAAIYK